jgi:esterase/lipase superfamily enzyme
MRELFSLTHHFIVKIYKCHQGNMFQLQGDIIRPLYKNRCLSAFLVYDSDPNCLHYWGTVVYDIVVWVKMKLK